MGRAKSFGCITSLDTDWDINGQWMQKLNGALPRIDYLMTNEEEAAMLTGKEDPAGRRRGLVGSGPEGRGDQTRRAGRAVGHAQRSDGVPGLPRGSARHHLRRRLVRRRIPAGSQPRLATGRVASGWPTPPAALCTTQISHRGITCLERSRATDQEPAGLANSQPPALTLQPIVTPRERTLAVVARERPDRLPREFKLTPPLLESFQQQHGADDPAEHFSLEVRDVFFAPPADSCRISARIIRKACRACGIRPAGKWANGASG